ncbi:MAG: hypothetical protein MZV70_19275 [Desulfobacterales bacterium]|nr:hypothetical protein [Desulfobacterales bacterium]
MTGKNVAVYRDGFRVTTSVQRGGVSTFQRRRRDATGADRGGRGAVGGRVRLGRGRRDDQSGFRRAVAGGLPEVIGTERSSSFYRSCRQFVWHGRGGALLQAKGVARHLRDGYSGNPIRTGGAIDSHSAATRFSRDSPGRRRAGT